MAKVRIDFPDTNPVYSTNLQVRITDINYGNHLANDKLVALLHEARVLMLQSLNYTEFDIEGHSLIQADLMVRYKGEGFQGDVLHIDIYVDNIAARSFDMLYKITAKRNGEDVAIADAKVGLVFFDYKQRKIAPTPENFTKKINALRHEEIGG